MYKTLLKVAFVVAIAMVAGINVFNAQKPAVLSDVAMENVEALANGESGTDSNCNNINGYKSWYVEINPNVDVNSERNQKKGFQDCCSRDKEGYLPGGDCRIG